MYQFSNYMNLKKAAFNQDVFNIESIELKLIILLSNIFY